MKMKSRASSRSRIAVLADQMVLLVDDHLPLLDCWRVAIEQRGAQLIAAPTISRACSVIDEYGPQLDAVILDYIMPDGDASRVVRALARTCSAPGLVLATAVLLDTARAIARRLRSDRLLPKPATAEDLISAIVGAIAAKRSRDEAPVASGAAEPEEIDDAEAHVQRVIDRLVRDILQRAGLTSAEGELALWNRLHGLGDGATARALGITESTVRNLLARACAELGADDCRDLLRVLLRELARTIVAVARAYDVEPRVLLEPVVDAMALLPRPLVLQLHARSRAQRESDRVQG